MICDKCGAEIQDGNSFCQNCGATIPKAIPKQTKKSAFARQLGTDTQDSSVLSDHSDHASNQTSASCSRAQSASQQNENSPEIQSERKYQQTESDQFAQANPSPLQQTERSTFIQQNQSIFQTPANTPFVPLNQNAIQHSANSPYAPPVQTSFQQSTSIPYVQPIQPVIQQPVYLQPVYQQPIINNNNSTLRKNGFATAGLTLGILSICLFWIPLIDVVMSVMGLVFSIIGVVKKNVSGKGKAIAGIVLSGIALFISCIFMSAFSSAASDSNNQSTRNTRSNSNVVATTQSAVSTKDTKANKEKFIKSCTELDFKAVARNPDDYVGKNFYYICYVSSARTGGSVFTGYQRYYITYAFDINEAKERINNGRSEDLSDAKRYCYDYDKCVWLLDNRDDSDSEYTKILENDVVIVYGTFTGLTESKNSLTGERGEQVSLDIKYVDILAE